MIKNTHIGDWLEMSHVMIGSSEGQEGQSPWNLSDHVSFLAVFLVIVIAYLGSR